MRLWSCRLLRTNKASTNLDGKTGLVTFVEILKAFGHTTLAITNYSQCLIFTYYMITYFHGRNCWTMSRLNNPLIVVIDKHSSISTISHLQILLIFMFLTATSTVDSLRCAFDFLHRSLHCFTRRSLAKAPTPPQLRGSRKRPSPGRRRCRPQPRTARVSRRSSNDHGKRPPPANTGLAVFHFKCLFPTILLV